MAARLTNRTERLIKMEQLLFKSAAGMRAVELAEACGVDRRTVYRDLSLLNEVGVSINQKDGRFCLQRDQYLATLRLSFDETVALLLAASTSGQENPHLASALAKLSQSLPDSVAVHANALTELIQEQVGESARTGILDTITKAWAEQRCVRLWLRSHDGSELCPREMAIYFIQPKPDGMVYVVGYDGEAERVRAFKLSCIHKAEMLQTSYQTPFPLDTRRFLFYLRGSKSKGKSKRADDSRGA